MSKREPRVIGAGIIANPEASSLKRIAWAFGCAKHGSPEERELLATLVTKVRQEMES